jgi:hypothetical protein
MPGTVRETAPCRTFQFAHDQTNNNGSINVLTPGNFGPLTIIKPISIVADGVEALINAPAGGAGIIIQAGGGAIVSLRGLTIDMRGTINDGIIFFSGAALHVSRCTIRRATVGIQFSPSSETRELSIADSVIESTSNSGIHVQPSGSGGASVMLDRVRVENSFDGIRFFGIATTGSITATVRDSVSTGHTGTGIFAADSGGGTTSVLVDRTTSSNNGTGIGVNLATIRIGDSTISGNTTGLAAVGGLIASYGTNKVDGNGADGPAMTPIAPK